MKRWSVLLYLILALIFVTSCSNKQEQSATVGVVLTDNQYKRFGNIVKENENFSIEWVDTQGYGEDGAFHLAGKLQCKLNDCSGIDVAIISPERLEAGSKAWYYKELNTTTINPHSYFCDSSKYGWYQNGKSVWCNMTIPANGTNISYDVKTITQIGSPYGFIQNPNNATVLWNTTTNTSNIVKTDITNKWNYKNRTTPYGDNIYYLQNINLFKGKEYEFELTLNIDRSKLPLKYSVVVGDMATNKIYYVLDPTIVNARTWSTNNDFTNGTVLTNLTSSASGITLTQGTSLLSNSNGLVSMYEFENTYADNNTQSANTLVTSGTGNAFNSTTKKLGSYSYQLDGNGFIYKDSPSALPGNNEDFSVAIWYRATSFRAGDVSQLMCFGDNPTWQNSFYLGPYDSGGGVYKYAIQTAPGMANNIANQVNIVPGTWYFAVMTWNGTPQYSNIYHNGVLNWSLDQTVNYAITKPSERMGVGTHCMPSGSKWVGQLDNAMYFNYTLTEEDVTALYNLGNGVSYPIQSASRTAGLYSDRQGWSPQAGNNIIRNISIVANIAGGANASFRFHGTNASLDTAGWIDLVNGTNNIALNLSVDSSIFYQFYFSGASAPIISSYTINEGYTNVIYTSKTWDTKGEFDLNTNVTNLTTSASGVTLTGDSFSFTPPTLLHNFTFNGNSQDNVTGTLMTDTSVSYVTGVTGQAIDCNGGSSKVGSATNYFDDIDNNANNMSFQLVAKGSNSGTADAQLFSLEGTQYFQLNTSGGVQADVNGGSTKTLFNQTIGQSWILYTATYDGTTLNLYMNKTLVKSVASSYYDIDSLSRAGYICSAWTGGDLFFNGTIDNFLIWNNVLSEAQINDTYNTYFNVVGKTQGILSDTQGWIPQPNNQITNLSVTVDNSSGGNIYVKYTSTNASLDATSWTNLVNGTQIFNLNLGVNNSLFYKFMLNNTGTGKIVNWVVSETIFTGSISGHVYDKNNQTVANAYITVINEFGNSTVVSLLSNSDGTFQTNVPNTGNYTLYAWKNSNISAGGAIKTHIEVT